MNETNRYAPPAAPVEAEPHPIPEFGYKLTGALLWRVLVLHTALVVPVVMAMSFADLNESVLFLKLKPSLLQMIVLSAIAGSLLVFRPGLIYLVWGYRLKLGVTNWRKFSWSFCILYLVLAATNVGVAIFAPTDVWLDYKAFVPFLSILALCTFAPRFMQRPNPSIERTCPGKPGHASHLKR